MPYFARASSVIEADGDGDDWKCDPFCAGWSTLTFAGQDESEFRYQAGAQRAQAGREVVMAPDIIHGIRASRRTFVPVTGRFVRFLDIFENTTTQTITFGRYVDLSHQNTAPWTVTATSSGDPVFDVSDGYAVITSDDVSDPEMAFVVAGPVSQVTRVGGASEVEDNWSWIWSRDQLTLAPGQRVALLRFAVQRPHGQTQEVQTQVEALRGLTDPDALAGLTPAERALILNFVVP
jgi:hypothetical protein